MSLQVVILIDMLGLSELTSAFGLVNMYHGIGTFIGPPLAGTHPPPPPPTAPPPTSVVRRFCLSSSFPICV